MINAYSSIISWIKSITSSILSWFFDLSNNNKILLFVVPLFVVIAISVLFDFIVPLFWDLPQWKIKKQVAVMTPKNTYGLQMNKHLIPRLPYQLRRSGIYRFFNNRTQKLEGYKTNELKGYKSEQLQGYKTDKLQTFKSEKLDIIKPSELSGFSTREIRALKPDELRDFSVHEIKSLNPVKIDSFKVSEIRPFKVKDLRSFSINSRIIASSSLRGYDLSSFYFRNFLREGSPNFSINTNFMLTHLGKASVINAQRTMQGGHDIGVDNDTGEVSAPSDVD